MYWDAMLAKAVATSAWKETLQQNIWEFNYMNSDRTRKLFESEHAEFRKILGELGLVK